MSLISDYGWNQITDYKYVDNMFSLLDISLFEEIGITNIVSVADADILK